MAHDPSISTAQPAEQPLAIPRQILLRRAAGYLELGELLVDEQGSPPASARRLLERSLGPGRQFDPPSPVTLAQLQSQTLRPGEILADLYVGEDQSLLFAVTRDTLVVQILQGRQAVQQLVAIADGHLQAALGPATLAAVHNQLRGLCAADPAAPESPPGTALLRLLAPCRSLIWSPDGPLHRLPLAALLPDPDLTVTQVPSATFLANLRNAAPDLTTSGPAARTPAVRILAAAGRSDLTGQPLPGAAAEVAWLQREFEGVVLPADSSGSVLDAIGQPPAFSILHLAGHAEPDAQRPWNSAILLGDADEPRWLRAGDLAGAPWPVQLAVLSSCSSGDGAVLPGEGLLGLAAGCLAAGTPAVLATLWPVADQDALRFNQRFYTELAHGRSVADALHRTQGWLRAQPGTDQPRQWAAYVLWGDGDLTFDLQRRRWSPGRLSPAQRAAAAATLAVLAAALWLGLVAVRRHAQRRRVQDLEMDAPSASIRKT